MTNDMVVKQSRFQVILFAVVVVMAVVEITQAAFGHRNPVHSWLMLGGLVSALGSPLAIRPLRVPLLIASLVLVTLSVITWVKGM
jgi:hypothetical protein